jgi:hypothetical protein
MQRRLVAPVVLVALIAITGSLGCAATSNPTAPAAQRAACGPASQERLDPRSSTHLFPGAAEPTYLSDPPTSGPHQLGVAPTGVVTVPIPRPRQVAMLERGFVLLQYQGLSASEVANLGGLAGSLVTVAPPAGPLPARVVATAWTWKETCSSAGPTALVALRAFIAARRGKGFANA